MNWHQLLVALVILSSACTLCSAATCDCKIREGYLFSCEISVPAPEGFKCKCTATGSDENWVCSGTAIRCEQREICLAGQTSICACFQTVGNCLGTVLKEWSIAWNCPPYYCNCSDQEEWKKGAYTIEKVEYNIDDRTIFDLAPKVLGQKIIPNNSSQTQSVRFTVTETKGTVSHFSHTGGVSIAVGTKFSTGIPFIAEGEISLDITGSYSHTSGESASLTTSIQTQYGCTAGPYKYIKCTVTLREASITVPYTITLKHKEKKCICTSTGKWNGVQSFHAKLVADERDLKK